MTNLRQGIRAVPTKLMRRRKKSMLDLDGLVAGGMATGGDVRLKEAALPCPRWGRR